MPPYYINIRRPSPLLCSALPLLLLLSSPKTSSASAPFQANVRLCVVLLLVVGLSIYYYAAWRWIETYFRFTSNGGAIVFQPLGLWIIFPMCNSWHFKLNAIIAICWGQSISIACSFIKYPEQLIMMTKIKHYSIISAINRYWIESINFTFQYKHTSDCLDLHMSTVWLTNQTLGG